MPDIFIRSADGKSRRFALSKDRVTIGRSRESDIYLPDQWLSRHHAEIRVRPDGHYLADLGSKNGTLLNGTRIEGEERLDDGDAITLGEHVLTFATGAAARPSPEPDEELPLAPAGTRIYSARELSDIKARPAQDAAELARQNRLLSVLSEGAKALIQHRPLPQLFEDILNLLLTAVPAERGAVMLLEGVPPRPRVTASHSRRGGPITSVSRSITRRVIEGAQSLLLPDVLEDVTLRDQESIVATGIRSAVCAPLWFSSGTGAKDEVIGLVYLDSFKGSHTFNEEDLRIVTALANVAAAKIENARLLEESLEKRRMEEDMRVAAEIQRSLLPKSSPQIPGWGLVGSNRPCRTVGGDYYDFAMEKGQLLLALGDVSGKGTGAALLMTVLRASVRAHWGEAVASEAVAHINRTVCQNVPENKYITFFMARLDPASGRLVYVNAGHNPPLLVRADGAVETLQAGGMVLGLLESVPYEDGEADLRPGDVLLIFSDGVTETWSAQDEEFTETRLAEVGVRERGRDAVAIEQAILSDLERFAAGTKATDDRTLIVLKRN